MADGLYLHHPSSLEHDTGQHPERAARITAVERTLAGQDWLGWSREAPPAATREAILAVHPPEHVAGVERICARGGGMIDADTVVSAGSLSAALHAAGAGVRAVDAVLGGEARTAFCALRPPGHHAERDRAMGFCLFNSIAVAARHARDAHGLERILIVDWDVHHGNGTQDVFYDCSDVLFASIHQDPLYPGTGRASERGSGAGAGFNLNLPVPPGSGDAVFCSLVEHVVAEAARDLRPQLVLVSAGFDAHADDPLADCSVTDEGFAAMAASVRRTGEEHGAPVVCLLEGGYDLGALSRSVSAVLRVLGADTAPAPPVLPRHGLAEAALRRLGDEPSPSVARRE